MTHSWTGIPEMRESYRKLGPLRFWSLIGSALAWVASTMVLQRAIGWPEQYGFRHHGRDSVFDDMWHSPTLLHHGGFLPDLLFLDIWAVLFVPFGIALWVKLRRRPDKLESTSYISDPE